MVDVKVSKRGFIYKEGKKKISDLPRIKDKNDIKITNISQNNINFRTNFIIGEQLKNLVRSQQSKKERFFVKNILDFLDKDANGKILGLYGLRRTGKTVALLQALKHLEDENKKAAYVLMSKNDFIITQYTPAGVGEWDLVIGNSSEMDIYEVKRSNTCNEYQTKWLTDLTMKDIGERFFRRKIRKRIVLYTGNDLIVIDLEQENHWACPAG